MYVYKAMRTLLGDRVFLLIAHARVKTGERRGNREKKSVDFREPVQPSGLESSSARIVDVFSA